MNVAEFRAVLTKERETIVQMAQHGDTCSCEDCYYEAMGRELDLHPISALRVVRGGCAGD